MLLLLCRFVSETKHRHSSSSNQYGGHARLGTFDVNFYFFSPLFILLSFISFFFDNVHFSSTVGCFCCINKNRQLWMKNGGGSHGKAWHIWDEFNLFSHFILYILFIFFFVNHSSAHYSLLTGIWENKFPGKSCNVRGSRGFARLDTIVVWNRRKTLHPYIYVKEHVFHTKK